MPFFNLRRNSKAAPAAAQPGQPESAEVIRRRAKHRLIGSAVLVLAGVLGFPLLFDTQPRPVSGDIAIEIPGRNTVKPLGAPPPAQPAQSAQPGKNASDRVTADSSLSPREEILTPKPAPAQSESALAAPKNEAKTEPKPDAKVAKVDPKPAVKLAPDDSARAKALLDGGSPPAVGQGRMIVQVGAFADVDKAREARQRLEKAGLKTYTQVADTKDGKRIRVRVGPFATKADAEKAASKIKTLDLPASILTL
jgi:DedD protein